MEMNKRELSVLKDFRERAMKDYMGYVMRHESAPNELLEVCCSYNDLFKALGIDEYSEVGA